MATNNGHASSSSSSTGKVSSKSRIQSLKMMHKLVATHSFITIIQDAFVNKRDSSAVVDSLLKHQMDIQLLRKTIMKMQRENEDEDDADGDGDVEEPESSSSSLDYDRVFIFQKKRTKMLLKDLQDDNVRNYERLYMKALVDFIFCFLPTRDDDDNDNDDDDDSDDDDDDDDDVEKSELSSSTVPKESSNLLEDDQKDIQESRNDQDSPQCVENLAESYTLRDHDSTNNNDLQQVGNQGSQDHSENSAESSNILEDDHQDDMQEARNDGDPTQAVVDMQQTQADDNNKELWPTLCDAEKKLKRDREMGIRNRKNKKKWNYRDD